MEIGSSLRFCHHCTLLGYRAVALLEPCLRYARTHWFPSLCGLTLIGFAAKEFAYTLDAYISDSCTVYAFSGLAALAFLRGIVSGVMPSFANVAESITAAVATLFCGMPFVFI